MWDWTDSDRQIAERFQLARLMHVIPELLQTVLLVDLDYTLHIHCEDLAVIDGLLANLEAVQLHVYIVLGCQEISFWSNKKLIACHMLGLQSLVDTCNDDEVIDMATAVIAQKQTQSAVTQKPSTQVDQLPG